MRTFIILAILISLIVGIQIGMRAKLDIQEHRDTEQQYIDRYLDEHKGE